MAGGVRDRGEGEGRLPYARPGGKKDEVARLESRRQPVQRAQAGWDADQLAASLFQSEEALVGGRSGVGGAREVTDALLREVEDHPLSRLGCLFNGSSTGVKGELL